MKVFLSHSGARGEVVAPLRATLEANGIQAIDAALVANAGEKKSLATVEQDLRESDAIVFMVEPGAERDATLQQEWRLALKQSWSTPDKPMIPIVFGDAELPAFLRTRGAIRMPPDVDPAETARAVMAALRKPRADEVTAGGALSSSAGGGSDAKQVRFEQISTAASALEASPHELATQAELLADRAAELQRSDPGSLELARVQIQHSDVLKALDRKEQALRQLEEASAILARYPDAQRRLARTRMNMARLLDELGRGVEARAQWEQARDAYLAMNGPFSLNALVVRASLISLLRKLGDNAAADAEQAALNRELADVATTAVGIVQAVRRGWNWLKRKRTGTEQAPDEPKS